MKTIKQAAEEQANDPAIVNQGYKLTAYKSFMAGAEFAQRWTPVGEELPEVPAKQVMVKLKCTRHGDGAPFEMASLGSYDGYCKRWNILHRLIEERYHCQAWEVTHWREIS